MALLKQENDSYKIYMGWYGKCGKTEVDETYSIKNHSEITAVYEVTNGGLNAFVKSAPDFLQSLLHFKAGNSYWIVLEQGTSEFEIPNLVVSKSQLSETDNIPVQMISNCGLSEDITPTPVPEPTPTPVIDKIEFRWADIAGREILQVKNILKPTHSNFDNRDTQNNWSTIYAFKWDESVYDISHDVWPDVAISKQYDGKYPDTIEFGDLTFSITQRNNEEVGDYYQLQLNNHVSHTEFVPNSDVSTPINLFIYSGDNNDPDNSALTSNENWPVIAKKQAIEPTPTPVTSVEPERVLKVPVILVGWDTGTDDNTSFHFRTKQYQFGPNGSRYGTIDDIKDMLMKKHYNDPYATAEESPSGSCADFYANWTRGRLKVEFIIVPSKFKTPNPTSENPNDYAYLSSTSYLDSAMGYDMNAGANYMIANVMKPAWGNAIENYGREKFYKDFPGVTPCFIQAGFSASDGAGPLNPWSHAWYFWYDSKRVTYQLNPFSMPLGGSHQRIKQTGVYVHETGHVFGPADLYGTLKGGMDNRPNGLGTMNMMASGSKGLVYHRYHNPSYPNGWTRWGMMKNLEMDIDTVTITEDTSDIEIYPFAEEVKAIRIFDPNNQQDVWWVDYREKNSSGYDGINYDRLLPDNESGLLISRQTFGRNLPVTSHHAINRYRSAVPVNRRSEGGHFISIFERDGKYQLNRGYSGYYTTQDLYRPDSGDEIGPHTQPSTVSYQGVPSGIKIHNIRKTDRGSILFDVNFLNEPNYKILDITYQSSSGTVNFVTEDPRFLDGESKNRNTQQQYTYISSDARNNLSVTIKTENIPDGEIVTVKDAYGIEKSSQITNNECTIDLSSEKYKLTTSKAKEMRFLSYSVGGDYSDTFVWNDCIVISKY